MKSTVENLGPTRVKLNVEVSFEELRPVLDTAYKRIAKQVRVPGFRPGKVPPAIIDRQVGRQAVLEEALQDAVPRFYAEALDAERLPVVGRPEVEVTAYGDGVGLVFDATVDVRPTVELPAYDGIPVTVDAVDVSDSDVEEQLRSLQDRFAVLKPVERPVAMGDYVLLDIRATLPDGTLVAGSEASGLSYEVGSDTLVPGLDRTLVGMSEGESRSFDAEIKFGEHAGQDATFDVTVTSVKLKEVPDLDDAFAGMASEFDTLDELRADIRERVTRMRALDQGVQARDRLLDALLERVDVPLPEAMVELETEWRRDQFEEQLAGAGLTLPDWLASTDRAEEDFDKEVREGAARTVKAELVLDAIAQKEELNVDEGELTDQVVRRAARLGVRPDEYAQRLVQQGKLATLMGEIMRGKALALVLDSAQVADSNGSPVDLNALKEDAGDLLPDSAASELSASTDDHAGHDHDAHAGHDHG